MALALICYLYLTKHDLRCAVATCGGAMCGSKLQVRVEPFLVVACEVHFKACEVQPQYRTLFWQ